MISIDQIASAQVAVRSNPGLAAHFRPLAELIADYERMEFTTESADYRRGCQRSAVAGCLEELCGGKTPQEVVANRIDGRDLWVFSRRLPICADFGIEPQGIQPIFYCPCCDCDSGIPCGELCPGCGADIWDQG